VVEVAVHVGFDTPDRVPHEVSSAEVVDPDAIHVLDVAQIPNANWLRSRTPGHAQQQFGMTLLQQHAFVALPSAVLPLSWNILFNPKLSAGKSRFRDRTAFSLDTRLNPPVP
jgi:RES domain-containing protein